MRDVTVALDRRERRKLETRQALRRSALRLVAERGMERVTIRDIADAADLSTRTFFNHFASKEEALVGEGPRDIETLRTLLAGRPADERPLEVLRAVLTAVADLLADRRDEIALQLQVLRDNPQLRTWESARFAHYEQILADELARRTGADPDAAIYPRLAAGAATAAVRAALVAWGAAGKSASLPALVEDAFDELAAGLVHLGGPPATTGTAHPHPGADAASRMARGGSR